MQHPIFPKLQRKYTVPFRPTKLQLIRNNAEICTRERFNQKHEICFFALALSGYIRGNKGGKVSDKRKKFHILTASQHEQCNIH